jgi:gluconolactonase
MNTFPLLLLSVIAADPAGIQSHAAPYPAFGSVQRLDPALDALLAPDAKLQKLAEGFKWSEGPVWVKSTATLIFSDVIANTAYRWQEGAGIAVHLRPSGYTGSAPFTGLEPGSNGLTVDAQDNLLLCQHGDRAVSRLNADGKTFTRLAERFEGKRFNSPNDLCFHRNGDLYFTDPPYGLPKNVDDPAKELPHQGVYRLSNDGKITLLTTDMERPNGIAFSPDFKTLYVANSHRPRFVIQAFQVRDDGTLGASHELFNAGPLADRKLPGAPDGLKVDQHGNLWATAPGGVVILSPQGKLLGQILTGQRTANCAWGDDGSTLYICADMILCRIRTQTRGAGW